ncbi:MAG: Wzz/FepE/Etk N-terminal domain-containing protein [Acutalibacteraceae bacterium]|nr:Wzz/FepE/Etk N-terminal domain-containing protein [Acutalibacteraceae bacterium]
MSTNTTQKTITLKGLIATALRYWRLLAIIVAASFIISVVYSAFIVTPMYTSTAKLYVINKASASNQITSTDFNISTYLTNDFKDLLRDEAILTEVATDLKDKYTTGALQSFIEIDSPENTRIIEIKVKSPNAKDSKKIADSICRISEEKLAEIMGLDRVKVIRNGSLPENPSSPNTSSDAFKGIILGFLIAGATAFAIMILDNKISSSEDVEKILGLNVLATIPYNETKLKKK